jgi:hypothetical protein
VLRCLLTAMQSAFVRRPFLAQRTLLPALCLIGACLLFALSAARVSRALAATVNSDNLYLAALYRDMRLWHGATVRRRRDHRRPRSAEWHSPFLVLPGLLDEGKLREVLGEPAHVAHCPGLDAWVYGDPPRARPR